MNKTFDFLTQLDQYETAFFLKIQVKIRFTRYPKRNWKMMKRSRLRFYC